MFNFLQRDNNTHCSTFLKIWIKRFKGIYKINVLSGKIFIKLDYTMSIISNWLNNMSCLWCLLHMLLIDISFVLVENLAYQKRALISTSTRHNKRHIPPVHGPDRAYQAVDGRLQQSLSFCTILDNLYGDMFTIDLGKKQKVSGLLIYTWQGEGKGTYLKTFVN